MKPNAEIRICIAFSPFRRHYPSRVLTLALPSPKSDRVPPLRWCWCVLHTYNHGDVDPSKWSYSLPWQTMTEVQRGTQLAPCGISFSKNNEYSIFFVSKPATTSKGCQQTTSTNRKESFVQGFYKSSRDITIYKTQTIESRSGWGWEEEGGRERSQTQVHVGGMICKTMQRSGGRRAGRNQKKSVAKQSRSYL